LPDVEDLWEFALFWNQSDAGEAQLDYYAPELLCLLGGNCNLIQPCDCDIPVVFADPDFEEVIREILDKPTGDICRCEMAQIKVISDSLNSGTNPNCPGDIGNLEGIQYAINLEVLALGCGFISDLSDLAGLVRLRALILHDNSISDLSPLALLVRLETLDLFRNDTFISDISALQNLTRLRTVNLSGNTITDISPLAGAVGMRNLDLSENDIADISPLSNMEDLEVLHLQDNQIADISVLMGKTQLADLDLSENQIADIGPLALSTLISQLNLSDNSIVDLTVLAGMTQMTDLFLEGNLIETIEPLTGLLLVDDLTLGNNRISDLSPISGMTGLTQLFAAMNQIADLSPLTMLQDLTQVILNNNRIASLETLPTLPQVTFLNLNANQIQDIPGEHLSRVPNLEGLQINDNQLGSLAGIAALPKLERLSIVGSGIDNSILATLPNHAVLEELFIGRDPISDLAPIQNLPNLFRFGAPGAMISDLSTLSAMTGLREIFLPMNQISDLSPLAPLSNLRMLDLDENNVANLTPITGLLHLIELKIRANLVTDLTPLVDAPDFGLEGLSIFASGNPLSFEAQCQQIPLLVARGISIHFPDGADCSTPTPTPDPSAPSATPTQSPVPTATRTPTPSPSPGADTLVWARSVVPTGSRNSCAEIAGIENGDFFITGHFSGTATFGMGETNEATLSANGPADIYLARYSPEGTLVWAKAAGSGGDDRGSGVEVLADGSAFVTGTYSAPSLFGQGEPNETTLDGYGQSDVFVAKYHSDGTLDWVAGNGGGGFDVGNGISALSDGGCVVAGAFIGTATFGSGQPGQTVLETAGGNDLFVARYNSDGMLVWAKRAGGANQDRAHDLSVADSVGVLLTGGFQDTAVFGLGEPNETSLSAARATDTDIFVAMYDLQGALVWAKRAGRGALDMGEGIDAFADGSSIVTGSFSTFALFGEGEAGEVELMAVGENDIFIAKYASDGSLVWAKQAGGNSPETGNDAAVMAGGSSFAVGEFGGLAKFGPGEAGETTLVPTGMTEERVDLFVAKYSPEGTLDWATKAGGDFLDTARGVLATSSGDAIVVGEFRADALFGAGESGEVTLPYTNQNGGSGIFIARYAP
jgi:Leucine-rich repeat (LRR) protein